MKLFGFEIPFRPRTVRTVVLRRDKLPEAEVALALQVPDDDPMWRALHQVIDEFEEEMIAAAQKYVATHGLCANALGQAEAMGLLRRRLLELRQLARKAAEMAG